VQGPAAGSRLVDLMFEREMGTTPSRTGVNSECKKISHDL
jgi:hypothetical protein